MILFLIKNLFKFISNVCLFHLLCPVAVLILHINKKKLIVMNIKESYAKKMSRTILLATTLSLISNDSLITNYERRIINLTSKIIVGSFPIYTKCLYYYVNNTNSNTDRYIEESLKQNLIPIVSLPKDNLNHYKDVIECDGYIVTAENYDEIKGTFIENKKGLFYYKTNKIVMIFHENYYDYSKDDFYLNVTHLGGLDLIVIEGYRLNVDNFIKITSIRHDEILLNNWSLLNDDADDIERERFRLDDWYPKFNFSNKLYNFRASVFDCPPLIFHDNVTKNVIEGTEYRILKTIRPELPIRFVSHYDLNGTGLWSLNLNDVLNNRSDIAMCNQWQISVATNDMDMSIPYMQTCSTFLVPKPNLLPQFTYVFQPFQIELWSFTAFLITLYGCLLYIISNGYRRIFNTTIAYTKIGIALMHSIRILTVGSTYLPPTFFGSLRQIIFFSSLTALLLSTAYSSGFTSSLTSPRYEKPINVLEDMVEQGTYWGAKEVDTFAVYNTTKNQFLQIINKRFKLEMNDNDRDDRISDNNYAFAINNLPNHYITDTEELNEYGKVHMKVLSECVGFYYLVFGYKRNSPYKKLIDKHINRCDEHGLINHWNGLMQTFGGSSYMDNFFKTYVTTKNTFEPLNIKLIQGIFIFLIIGYVISVCILFLELLCSRRI